MKILRTPLHKIESGSTGVANPAFLNAAASGPEETVVEIINKAMTYTREPATEKFSTEVLAYVNNVINMYLREILANGTCYKHHLATNDVGFVFDVSYSTVVGKGTGLSAEVQILQDDNTIRDFYLHYRVVLPNGTTTTWRIDSVEDSNWLAYISQY
jgi:hypothetical protein